jgi:pimeloyl-ACP methyl ester carboxylesterase
MSPNRRTTTVIGAIAALTAEGSHTGGHLLDRSVSLTQALLRSRTAGPTEDRPADAECRPEQSPEKTGNWSADSSEGPLQQVTSQSTAMSEVSQEQIKVGKRRVGLRRTTGRGHPVVMLHGLMDCAMSWDPFAQALSRPTYAFDLPGFGESSTAGDELYKWRRLFTKALDQLEIESCFLLGHSLGGALATTVASSIPDRVRGMLLMAPAGFGPLPLAQVLGRPEVEFILGRTAPHAMRFKPVLRLAYSNIFSNRHTLSETLADRLLVSRQAMVPGIRNGMHILRDLSHQHFAGSEYAGPVDTIWGEHDRLVPPGRGTEGVLEVFPEARTEILDGIGHHPQEEDPVRTLEWLANATESKILEPLMLAAGETLG